MTLPNFLIIGASKAGTTSLYHYLRQHPQVYMPQNKEPRFFIYEGGSIDPNWPGYNFIKNKTVTDLPGYQELYRPVTNEIAIGEATAGYLSNPGVPDRILKHIPDAKFIAILRDPAERAYSAFLMDIRNGLDNVQLSEAVERYYAKKEPPSDILRQRAYISYIRAGFYYQGLTRYYQRFDSDQIGVFFFEDFKRDPACLVRNVFGFLDVDQAFQPNMGKRYNVSLVPRNRRWNRLAVGQNLAKRLIKRIVPVEARKRISKIVIGSNLIQPAPISRELRSDLIEIYRQDILRLQDMCDRDLSLWLKV